MNSVPTIDLAPFLQGDAASRLGVARALGRAAEQIGFFTITGHGIPTELMDRLYDRAHEFFELSVSEKERVAPPTPSYPRGYKRVGFEALAAGNQLATPPDLKEYWHFGRPVIPDDPYYTSGEGLRNFFPNFWPHQPTGFAAAADTYYRAMERLSEDLCRLSALALDLPEHWFADKIDRHITSARINYYPPQLEAPAAGQLRAGTHTDYGMITILSGEPAPGLQVQTRSGEWVDVATDKYRFVCNIGDLLMRWTNDRWVSNPHRVLNPTGETAYGSSRMSIAFFHHPNYDADIECIPSCSDARPPKYEPVRAGAFRDYKYSVTRAAGQNR